MPVDTDRRRPLLSSPRPPPATAAAPRPKTAGTPPAAQGQGCLATGGSQRPAASRDDATGPRRRSPAPSRPPLAIGRWGDGGGPRAAGGASPEAGSPSLGAAPAGSRRRRPRAGRRGRPSLGVAGWPLWRGAAWRAAPGGLPCGGARRGPRRPSPPGGPAGRGNGAAGRLGLPVAALRVAPPAPSHSRVQGLLPACPHSQAPAAALGRSGEPAIRGEVLNESRW